MRSTPMIFWQRRKASSPGKSKPLTYYIIFAVLLMIRLVDDGRKPVGFYWPVLIGLYVFSAFRFEVGCDWGNYLGNFWFQEGRSFQDAVQSINPGHWMLIETLHELGLGYYWLNFVTSAIFFAGLHAVARRSPAPMTILVLAFPVLILNMPMAAVKQAAAIGFLCFAFNAFIDRRMIRFLIWTALAAAFHGSAIVFLMLLPFWSGIYTTRSFIYAGILAIPAAGIILSSDSVEVATTRYIVGDADAGGAIFRVGLLFATGVFYVTMLSKRWAKALPKSHALISLLAFGMIGTAVLIPVSTVIADRLGYFLIVPQLMIFAALPTLYPGRKAMLIKLAPYAALTLLFVAWTLLSSHYRWCYVPYSTTF